MRPPHHEQGRTPREVEAEGTGGRFGADPDPEREPGPVARGAAAPRAGYVDNGARLAVVEYRTGKLESRFAGTDPRSAEPCETLDCSES